MEKKSETSSTWVSELEKSEAELGPQENEEVPVVRLWPEPLRTVMEVQGGRTLVRWDGAIAKPDGEDAEEESDEGASW